MQKILFYGFWFASSEAGIIVIASLSFLFHLNCIYVHMYGRESEECPPSFFSLLHYFLFLFSLMRNAADALLLHHNYSCMTIQCLATLEQNGNWVKTSSKIHWSLWISTSQSMSSSANCLSPQKLCDQLTSINCVQPMKLLFQNNQLHFYMTYWKNNTLCKWIYKHCHLTPLCLHGLIKEEKLEKIFIQHTQTKWLAK